MFAKTTKLIILSSSLFLFLNIAPAESATEIKFRPQVTVGNFTADTDVVIGSSTETIGKYIRQIYNYAIGAVGIIAVVVMMVGGAIWITSMGNPTKVTEAKNWIAGALTGMVLVMSSYVILKTINPNLVNLPITAIPRLALTPVETTTVSTLGFAQGAAADVCCDNPSDCGSGFTCNTTVLSSTCSPLGKGHCVVLSGQGENTTCDTAQTNQCAPPLKCFSAVGGGAGRCLYDNYYGCGDGSQTCRSVCDSSHWHLSGDSCPLGLWCCNI